MSIEPFQHASELSFSRRLAHHGMAILCDYWIRLGGGTRVPAYRDFDPLAVHRVLPDLQLTRREAGGRHRIGRTGAGVVDLMARDNTGKCLDEVLPGALYASRAMFYDGALGSGLPVAFRTFLVVQGRQHRFSKRLLLPFIDEGPDPDVVVAMMLAAELSPGEPPVLAKDGIAEILVATRASLRLDAGLAREMPIQ